MVVGVLELFFVPIYHNVGRLPYMSVVKSRLELDFGRPRLVACLLNEHSVVLWGFLMASAAVMLLGVINMFGVEGAAAAAAATLVN